MNEEKTELDYYREKAHILLEKNCPSLDDTEITLTLGIISPNKSFTPSKQTAFEVKIFHEGEFIEDVEGLELKMGEDLHKLCDALAGYLLNLPVEDEEE